jgi:NhaP-type Na+/H+ and K+/H+ antiporter
MIIIKSQSEKMTNKSNLKFNIASMVNIIQKFLSSETVQHYMKLFKVVDEKTDTKLKKTTALRHSKCTTWPCLCHIFGAGM